MMPLRHWLRHYFRCFHFSFSRHDIFLSMPMPIIFIFITFIIAFRIAAAFDGSAILLLYGAYYWYYATLTPLRRYYIDSCFIIDAIIAAFIIDIIDDTICFFAIISLLIFIAIDATPMPPLCIDIMLSILPYFCHYYAYVDDAPLLCFLLPQRCHCHFVMPLRCHVSLFSL